MEEKSECKCKAFLSKFRKAPHFFKPVQIVAFAATIIGIFIYDVTALASLLTSSIAAVAFGLGIQHRLANRYSCGYLTWNAVEFLYSLILAILCGISTVESFGRADWGAEFVIVGILFLVLTISFLTSVVYIARGEMIILMDNPERLLTVNPRAQPTVDRVNESEKATGNAEYVNYLFVISKSRQGNGQEN